MRRTVAISLTLILSVAGTALAQEWVEFVSREDGFRLDFPHQPSVQNTTYMSEYGYTLPARQYKADAGDSHYMITIVDYNGIEKLGKERSAKCPAGAETCKGSINTGDSYSKMDVNGAIVFATFRFIQRDAKVTHLTWSWVDLVEGQSLQLTNNADKSRTFAFVSMHRNRLYIVEATVPAGYPAPGLFQQSMGYVDSDGTPVRYQVAYSNRFPPPPRIGSAPAAVAGTAEQPGTPAR